MRRNIPSAAQVRAWRITPSRDAAPEPTPPPVGCDAAALYGYGLADIDRLTRLALRADRWYAAGDMDERFDTARHAIIDALLDAQDAPSRSDLIGAALRASDAAVREHMRTHGRDGAHGGRPMPAFHRFWEHAPHRGASPETRVVEVHALTQIWPRLTQAEQRALVALAQTDDYRLAAQMLGMRYGTFTTVLSDARRRFLRLWHEGEEPSGVWRTDRRSATRSGLYRGRARLTAEQVDVYRERHRRGETLRALAVEAGLSRPALGALVRGATKPAQVPA